MCKKKRFLFGPFFAPFFGLAAQLFLGAIDKFFVGQQQEAPLLEAIAQNLSEISEGERRAEEKYNKFRLLAREKGSAK